MIDQSEIGALAEHWASRWALHALPFFENPHPLVHRRRNTAWNWGFLVVQAVALASYFVSWPAAGVLASRHAVILAFSIAVYGWIDLSLCVVRKTFLLHIVDQRTSMSDRIGSAWLMFASLTLVYANLYFMMGRSGACIDKPLVDPVAALAFSASTMTTVGYGYYAPVDFYPVVFAFLQALSGLALISCVIAAAISSSSTTTDADRPDTAIATSGQASLQLRQRLPWLVAVGLVTLAYGLGILLTSSRS